MKPTHHPESLDMQAFAQDQLSLTGARPLRQFERLAGSAVAGGASQADIAWQARAELRPVRAGTPEVWLHLAAQGAVDLECQRCLEPVRWPLDVACWIQFVAGDDAAQALDTQSEHDVLPLPRRLDLFELLEDELLLALPLIARHDVCAMPADPGAVPAAVSQPAADTPASHPFAVLAGLKREPPGH